MDKNLKFSASTSQRWLNCTASVKAIASLGNPYETNQYAERGKRIHEQAERALYNALKAFDVEGDKGINVYAKQALHDKPKDTIQQDIIVQEYVQYVSSFVDKNTDIYIEQIINYKGWVPKLYHGNGFSDCILINHDKREAHTIDLKTGDTYVEAKANPQTALYALGVYKDILKLDKSYTHYSHIVQPSIGNMSFDVYSTEELLKFGEYVKTKTTEALENPTFSPSTEVCQYCAFKGHCKALKNHIDKVTDCSNREKITNKERSEIIRNKKLIQSFIDEVQVETAKIMQSGEKIEGLKLVSGITRRTWKDESSAIQAMLQYASEEQLYTKKIISISQASDLLKDSFSKIEDQIVKPKGKPQCVPDSDRRKAIDIALDMFD